VTYFTSIQRVEVFVFAITMIAGINKLYEDQKTPALKLER